MVDRFIAAVSTGTPGTPAGRRSRRRLGIAVKVGLAFAIVAGMAVASETVAWLSFRRIESELAAVVGRAVPVATTAETLAVEATAIVGATGSLTAALTEDERAGLMAELAGRVQGLNQRLDDLARLEVDRGALAALRDRISALATNLDRLGDLVRQRIALRNQIQSDAAQLADGHKQFLNAVTPRVDNTYRALFSGIKTLVDDLGSAHPSDASAGHPPVTAIDSASAPPANSAPASYQDMVVLRHRIGQLFNRSVGEMLALLELAAAGNLADGLLNEAILVADPAQLHQLRARFNEVTISMGTIRLNLATTSDNQVLLGLTTPMLQYGLGSDNLFDQRRHELALVNVSNAVVAENRGLSEALTAAVDRLLASARASAEASARDAQADAAYARLFQAVATALAVALALVFGWRYVGREVIGRILALQRAMEAEAAGREMVIPAQGDDEITDMAAALSHFVSRRKQAEADLRTAKDRAEGAFAELKELQEALVQTEKMAALGGLVAGVAHELNTPVGVCLTAASLLAEKTDDLAHGFGAGQLRKSKVQEYIEIATEVTALIRSNLERAGELVRVFKQVAIDSGEGERQLFRVREHIEMVLTPFEERIRTRGHTVVLDCPAELAMDGFAEALRQVLTVLVDNALTHAYDEGTSGTITIAVSAVPAGTVTLTVSDDGLGIRPEDQSRVFEPFFTTKRSQGGIGLGLHMAFNIVSSVLGGRIVVESQPGCGSRFIVTVPETSPAPLPRRRG
jgi:signal transduction histidine kinase